MGVVAEAKTRSGSVAPRTLEGCCTQYHRAVELIGKRWSGAILFVMTNGPLRFSEIRHLVPDLSDRLLSERLKELEAENIVERRVYDEVPVRVEYLLTAKGHALEPVLRGIKSWANEWMTAPADHPDNGSPAA
jgi:DNA-binding HxlR family transcriptional regulator